MAVICLTEIIHTTLLQKRPETSKFQPLGKQRSGVPLERGPADHYRVFAEENLIFTSAIDKNYAKANMEE